jgi:hypothetical protein
MSTLNCALCSQPVNLTIDLVCDETGKAVHEQCYVDRITGGKDTALPPPAFEKYVAHEGLRPEQHGMTCGVRAIDTVTEPVHAERFKLPPLPGMGVMPNDQGSK